MDTKTEKFLQSLDDKGLYRDDYDYSLVEYKDVKTPIIIIDENGNKMSVVPSRYLYGKFKGKLHPIKNNENKTEKFLQELKSKGLFRDDCDYSKVQYKNQTSKIIIIDNNGLEYRISAKYLLKGTKISGSNTTDKQKHFIFRCKELYSDKFKFDKVKYVNIKTPVTVECDVHGDIVVIPHDFVVGRGCIKCNEEERNVTKYLKKDDKTEDFIQRAKSLRCDYDYSLVEFINSMLPVTIIDDYGFLHKKTPSAFLMLPVLTIHSACDKTAYFKHKIKLVNGNKYGISKVIYIDEKTPVIVFDNDKKEEVLMRSAKLLKKTKQNKW